MKNSNFKARFKNKLYSCIPVIYPETKNDYVPNFDNPVYIEKNFFKNFTTYLRTLVKIYNKKIDLAGLEWTYNSLSDEYSKEMFLNVVIYRLFNEVKIRYPLYYSPDFTLIDDLENKMRIDNEEINLWFDIIKLKKYDLKYINYDIKIWIVILGCYVEFIREQYRYKNILHVEKGDYIIDGGACYGDTALYFAERGAEKVFSFEFLEENINIFNKNMELNPHLVDKITLVKNPLGETSGEKLYAIENGPGTSVTPTYSEGAAELETITIDDFVERNNIERIDFIKLDIECSEVPTLKGAIKTIQKFKPKLAICVYHKDDDLWTIPQLIKEILPDYSFYLDHHTINFTETVLYARIL